MTPATTIQTSTCAWKRHGEASTAEYSMVTVRSATDHVGRRPPHTEDGQHGQVDEHGQHQRRVEDDGEEPLVELEVHEEQRHRHELDHHQHAQPGSEIPRVLDLFVEQVGRHLEGGEHRQDDGDEDVLVGGAGVGIVVVVHEDVRWSVGCGHHRLLAGDQVDEGED